MADENTNRLQSVLLDMLEETIRVCETHDIPYYLVEGSCLGAVRHGGFIPWDDDLDIAIPATAVELFEESFEREAPSKYQVIRSFTTEGEELPRVVDTSVQLAGGLLEGSGIVHPMIDVLLMSGLPKNKAMQAIHYRRIWLCHKLYKAADPSHILRRDRSTLEKLVIWFAKANAGRFDQMRVKQHLRCAMQQYPITDKGMVFCITFYGRKEIMPAAIYGNGRRQQFNRLNAVVPTQAEEYLSRLYGDWSQLPPEEERIGKHHLRFVD